MSLNEDTFALLCQQEYEAMQAVEYVTAKIAEADEVIATATDFKNACNDVLGKAQRQLELIREAYQQGTM